MAKNSNPGWLMGLVAVAVGAAWLTGRSSTKPQGSANAPSGAAEKLSGQVTQMLNTVGIEAVQDGSVIRLGADPKQADSARVVAERTLLSTGFRPKVGKDGGRYTISVVRGPPMPASADPALRI